MADLTWRGGRRACDPCVVAAWGNNAGITAHEVDRLRATLRVARARQRLDALGAIAAIEGQRLGRESALGVLRAAGTTYPWVPGVPEDPAELLMRLLWADPTVVSVAELERTYTITTAGGRRGVLRALALRRDPAGLDAVAHLLEESPHNGLLPAATEGLLDPLLDVPGIARIVPGLLATIDTHAWSVHSGHLLVEIIDRGLLERATCEAVSQRIRIRALTLVEEADRRAPPAARGSVRRDATQRADPLRVDRRRLHAIIDVLAVLPADSAVATLRRLLAAVDPIISARAAVALVGRGEVVAEERLRLLARDPRTRGILAEGFARADRQFLLPELCSAQAPMAEGVMVEWLASANQLRCPPDEIEHRGLAPSPVEWGSGVLHLFAFRVRAPHFAAERDWMIGAVGPYDPACELYPGEAPGFAAHSLFEPFVSATPHEHLRALSESLNAERRT